jgi:hypothetical protein
LRFSLPQSFRRIVHAYPAEVWTQYRIRKAAIKTSDDGIHWTDAAQAEERDGQLHFELESAGAHAFWRMVVLESGDAREVVFGNLRYRDNDFIRDFPLDVAWLCLAPALVLLFLTLSPGLTPGRLFVSVAIPVALFVSMYSFGYVTYHTIFYPDSFAYMQRLLTGGYESIRSPGYPFLLLLISKVRGLDELAWVQLGTIIACYLAGAWILVSHLERKWLGPALVAAFAMQGATISYADQILTEAFFTAGVGLFAASLGALAGRPGFYATIAGMIGIALAILAKSIALVLVVPAVLLVRFMPKRARLCFAGPVIAAGILTYGALAVHGYWRTGSFAPESFAGYALLGQVAWMLDENFMPQSEIARALREAVAPVVEQRPADLARIDSLAALDRYVDYTVQEYNRLLWGASVPAADRYLSTSGAINGFFLQYALSSIRTDPLAYLGHAAAHFYGLWRDLGRITPLKLSAVGVRYDPLNADPSLISYRNKTPRSILTPYPEPSELKKEFQSQQLLPLAFEPIWNQHWIRPTSTICLGILALGLSLLFVVPGRLAWIYRTEIMIALALNAYFAAHVLLQVSLIRYAQVGVLAALMLAMSFIFTSGGLLATPLKQGLTLFALKRPDRGENARGLPNRGDGAEGAIGTTTIRRLWIPDSRKSAPPE